MKFISGIILVAVALLAYALLSNDDDNNDLMPPGYMNNSKLRFRDRML